MVSPRQEDILLLLEQGNDIDSTADALELSPNTVLAQVTRVRARYGLTCPTRELPEAVRKLGERRPSREVA